MVLRAESIKGLFKDSDCEFQGRTGNMVVHLSLNTFSCMGRGTVGARVGFTWVVT